MNNNENNNIPTEESGENKTFSQEDVNKIVQERLAREKGKYQDYEDLQAINKILDDFDYGNMTLAKKKEVLKENAEAYKKQKQEQQEQELSNKASESGIDPELLKEIERMKTITQKIEEEQKAKRATESQKAKIQEDWQKKINEFSVKYANIDLKELLEDKKFKKLIDMASSKTTLCDIYEIYTDSVQGDNELNNQRATGSGKQSGNVGGNFYNLTTEQRQLCDETGMKYQDYAEVMKKIK